MARASRMAGAALAAIGLVAAIGGVRLGAALVAEIDTPVEMGALDYVQSRTCIRCHPAHYDSWHCTFHRTMTQRAGRDAVLGDFDDASYTFRGVTSRFTRQGERYFIETLDRAGAMSRFEITMTVGSRRVQQYVARQDDRHIRLPLAWNIEEGRWFHLNGGFLHPDGSDFNTHTAVWDANCIFCHNVKARPRFDFAAQRFDSGVAELGIACEACHGPGEEHIARNANPLRRYLLYAREQSDPTIVWPKRLSRQREVQICGHCHGQRLPNPLERIDEFVTVGDPYTAGDDLDEIVQPIWIDTEMQDADFSLRFWGDGTPRLTAYEYQGVLQSVDYQKGELRCTSCHSMHGGDPRGMITDEMRGPQACLQCHPQIGRDIAAHTHHKAAGSGSDCYACHMPDITYGLLDVHPTHRIRNPDPARAWRHEMPEACTLCHTNQTAAWAARKMSELYGSPLPPDLPAAGEREIAENVRALLGGDVLQRAVAVMALADSASYAPGPAEQLWALPLLIQTMRDSYPAVRHFAYRGVCRLLERAGRIDPRWSAGRPAAHFDPLDDEPRREAICRQWDRWWTELEKAGLPHPGEAVPLDEQMQPIAAIVAALVAEQDERIIAIGE